MDTSEKYIKMCEKAEEIQKMRLDKWEEGDYVFDKGYDDVRLVFQNAKWLMGYGIYMVWLPRQDQLQEMIWLRVPSKKPRTLLIWLLNSVVFPEDPPTNKNIADNENKYWEQFDSMEQLWLAFVMKEKFNKIWDDKKGEWVKT